MKTCLIVILLYVSSLYLKAQSINKIIEPINHNQLYKYALITEYKGKVALLGKYPIGSTITLMNHSKGKTFNTYAKSVKIRYDEYAGNVTITTLANQPPGSSISTETMFQMTAIINTPVKNYVALKVVSISDRKLIANTDKLVRASGLMSKILNQNSGSTDPKFNKIYLDALNNKLPLVNKVIVPEMEVYVLKYTMTSNSIGPRFIFINKKLYPLTGQCSQSILFPYQIGTNYFIRTGSGCCECGIIADQIFEITSNGLKTELNDQSRSN